MENNKINTDLLKNEAADTSELADFMDLEYSLEAHIGKTALTVHQLLHLEKGETLVLNRLASEHITLVVGDVTVAKAEVLRIKSGVGARVVGLAGGER